MTILEPLPTTGYGKADWVDYSNYWREADSEWLMERSVLRYADAATRTSQIAAPKFGQVVYNESSLGAGLDRLELYSKQHNAWVPLLMLANIVSTVDTAAAVGLAHRLAGGKGVSFQPTLTVFDNPVQIMGGVLAVDSTGATIKTGTKTVKLTTDATNLVVDSPISATALTTAGAVTAASGTITTLAATNITMTGTMTGGVLNGTSGTIGGVAHASNKVTASAGFDSASGTFYGDASSAIMRHTNRTGSYVQVLNSGINIGGGGNIDILANSTMRVLTNAINYIRSDGVHTGYIAPSFWGDPGVGNCPEGSIYIS